MQNSDDLSRWLRWLDWYHNSPMVFRYLFYALVGDALMMVPVVCDYIFLVRDRHAPFLYM